MLQVEVANVAPVTAQKPDEKFAHEVRRYLAFEGGLGEKSNPLRVRKYSYFTVVVMRIEFQPAVQPTVR